MGTDAIHRRRGCVVKLEFVILTDGDQRVTAEPIWQQVKVIQGICGLPAKLIRKWADDGEVRSKKLDGDAQRAARLYRVQDVLDKIEELPDGKRKVECVQVA